MEGKVKFFNEQKGFGFITESETGADYFVHGSGCKDLIKKDDSVTFELVESKRGLRAINVFRKK